MEHRNLNKIKKTETISDNFSDHIGMKVKMNKRKLSRPKYMWERDDKILNN